MTPQLSARAERLLAWLTELADIGEPCPLNTAIEHRLGAPAGTGSQTIDQLVSAGLISIERAGTGPSSERIVTILSTGRATAPRRARPVDPARPLPSLGRKPKPEAPPDRSDLIRSIAKRQAVAAAPPPPAAPASTEPAPPPPPEEPALPDTPAASVLYVTPAASPFSVDVRLVDGEMRLAISLTTDRGPMRQFREFLTIPLDEMHALELLGTCSIALRDLRQARGAA